MNREEQIEQVKKIIWEYKEPLLTHIAQEIVALFTPREQKPEVLEELRENLKEILPGTILTSVEAGITADQIIEMVLDHGYVKMYSYEVKS